MRKAVHQLFNLVATAILFVGCVKADNILDPYNNQRPEKPKDVEIKKTYHDANAFVSGPSSIGSFRFQTTDNTDPGFDSDPNGDLELEMPNAWSFFEARDTTTASQTPFNAAMFKANTAHIFKFRKHVNNIDKPDTTVILFPDTYNGSRVTFYGAGRFDYYEANRLLGKTQENLPGTNKKPAWSLHP